MNSAALLNSVDVFAETLRYLRESRRAYSNIETIKMQWAKSILSMLNTDVEVIGQPSKAKSIIYIGNHISYLDIPLLLSEVSQISFVAKQELSKWPVFGSAARRVDTVFVKRENGGSRKSARLAVQQALANGKRVVLFPSGTTCMTESKQWRKGAFEIAKDLNISVQPFRISYSPLREVAYIDRDFFPVHLYKLSTVQKVQARIEFHDLVTVSDAQEDCIYWQKWSRGLQNGNRE